MSGLSDKLERELRDGGARFERYNGESEQLWYSPITQRLVPVPAALDAPAYALALRRAGLGK